MEKIRFLADENFNQAIFDGIRLRLRDLDLVRVQDVGLRTVDDRKILEFAARQSRILLTHDIATMKNYADARLSRGESMPGVLLIHQDLPIGRAIEEIVMMIE